jgi:hypothetical protein
MTTKTPLMLIVEAAAARFDARPLYRASIEARQELADRSVREGLATKEMRP